MLRPFLIALQFLTTIPMPKELQVLEGDMGRSLLFYPVVGGLVGLLLVLTAVVTQESNSFLSSALVVTVWVLITGGLHLDGLSDTADAWIGGIGSRERTLEIMKDSAAGPMGVISLVLILLVKTAAVYSLLLELPFYYLILPPLLGRTMVLLLLATTPYVREGGLAKTLVRELKMDRIWIIGGVIAVSLIMFNIESGFYIIASCAALLWVWHRLLMKRLGGCTGDTAGALIEVAEVTVLFALIFSL